VQVIVDRAVTEAIVARLSVRDRRLGEDARAAVEWLTGFEGDELPAVFSRRELQQFLWYQLPKKWLVRTDEQQAVAAALASFFDEIGAEAVPLAELCRSSQTEELIESGGKKLAEAVPARMPLRHPHIRKRRAQLNPQRPEERRQIIPHPQRVEATLATVGQRRVELPPLSWTR